MYTMYTSVSLQIAPRDGPCVIRVWFRDRLCAVVPAKIPCIVHSKPGDLQDRIGNVYTRRVAHAHRSTCLIASGAHRTLGLPIALRAVPRDLGSWKRFAWIGIDWHELEVPGIDVALKLP